MCACAAGGIARERPRSFVDSCEVLDLGFLDWEWFVQPAFCADGGQ